VSLGTEEGLLGLAFHPAFAQNGLVYVDYTANDWSVQVVRYRVSPDQPDVVDPASAEVVLNLPKRSKYHNGGMLAFGPDGYLYVSVGDDEVSESAQDLGTLVGKILRLDVDAAQPYAVPPSNPFANQDGARGEIWSYGLRNPWRFSFDRATGDLWIGDVGDATWEEVDFQPASSRGGGNYGWSDVRRVPVHGDRPLPG
jgi:glucose/arabinose dehydrogenase